MTSGQKFLAKCAALKDKGIHFEFEQGHIVARGYADLGYEEFVLLASNKICSLYSGKISELPEEEKKHFFIVPDQDMMTDKIIKTGLDIESIVFENQRNWKLTVVNTKMKNLVFSGVTVKDVFLECLTNL
jgi:hypothetical protein